MKSAKKGPKNDPKRDQKNLAPLRPAKNIASALSKSFSPPKICTFQFSPWASAGVATPIDYSFVSSLFRAGTVGPRKHSRRPTSQAPRSRAFAGQSRASSSLPKPKRQPRGLMRDLMCMCLCKKFQKGRHAQRAPSRIHWNFTRIYYNFTRYFLDFFAYWNFTMEFITCLLVPFRRGISLRPLPAKEGSE